ncbi:MAG: hypothetical protein RIS35_98 [Pseudomonadota bacterium]|jgi:signal transduction histidine kinase
MTSCTATLTSPPSIQARLGRALALWSILWGLAVGAAIWSAATHEVDELLDDTLKSSAGLIAELVAAVPALVDGDRAGISDAARFAWQLTDPEGRMLMRSRAAPSTLWHEATRAGFSDHAQWRVYGTPLAQGRMLYVGQTRAERQEAGAEVGLRAVLAALAVGLLGQVWIRARVRSELRPLQELSDRLAHWNPDAEPASALGPPTRRELAPVLASLDALASRLAARMASERAFSAHAAHALRTPLAGIDAQLAVALRDCPESLRDRLQRVREAATRLQTVVSALLGLFRSGSEPRIVSLEVDRLIARLPTPSVATRVDADVTVRADPDLLAAALGNLLDNAQRHGAGQVWIEPLPGGGLRLRDDGPGVEPDRRERLQSALDRQAYEDGPGLGLMLADRVARAHGGRLDLPPADHGFVVELRLPDGPNPDRTTPS